jgi:hypothetical protein
MIDVFQKEQPKITKDSYVWYKPPGQKTAIPAKVIGKKGKRFILKVFDSTGEYTEVTAGINQIALRKP